MSNITGIPRPLESDIRKLLERAKRQEPEMFEVAELIAREAFRKFKAYQAAGFNVEQAMRLICAEHVKASV